jgi:hypothetical protein
MAARAIRMKILLYVLVGMASLSLAGAIAMALSLFLSRDMASGETWALGGILAFAAFLLLSAVFWAGAALARRAYRQRLLRDAWRPPDWMTKPD